MNNQVGNRIRKLRDKKGISQEAMAIELDISQSSYGRLEKNDNRLTVPKLEKIAKILDITICYLFNEKSDKTLNISNNKSVQFHNLDKIIKAEKKHIKTLKQEIVFLRGIIK